MIFLYAICMTLFPMGSTKWGFRLAHQYAATTMLLRRVASVTDTREMRHILSSLRLQKCVHNILLVCNNTMYFSKKQGIEKENVFLICIFLKKDLSLHDISLSTSVVN